MHLCDDCKEREATVFNTYCEVVDGQSRITRKRNLCEVCAKNDPEISGALASNPGRDFSELSYAAHVEQAAELTPLPASPYAKAACMFVMSGLVKAVVKKRKEQGDGIARLGVAEVMEELRIHAIQSFGGKALAQLQAWGIRSCMDFWEIIFTGALSRAFAPLLAESAGQEEFDGGYDFKTAFPVG